MPGQPDKPRRTPPRPGADGVVRLSGGNPQIAKGYGEAPLAAYIAAMPGWMSPVGKRLDAIITRTVPNVSKAVKWNSPFYGMQPDLWFLNFHCMTRYIKVAFFQGASLDPAPEHTSKYPQIRYFHIHQATDLDEDRFADWVAQASLLPGEKM